MHRLLFFLFPFILASCDGLQLGEKKDKFSITVHGQGTIEDSPRSIFKMPIPGFPAPKIFKLVPEFTQHNIAAFNSFPASDGNGFGVTLRLDFRASENLSLATRTRQGEVLLAMVNGQPVDVLTIDKPVSDGLYTIWEGVTQQVVDEMTKKYPPIKKLKSVSTGQEMLPTTRGEKKRVMEDLEKSDKVDAQAAKKKAANPNAPEPEKPNTDSGFPRAPSKVSPLEGGMHDRPKLPVLPAER